VTFKLLLITVQNTISLVHASISRLQVVFAFQYYFAIKLRFKCRWEYEKIFYDSKQ